MLHITSAKYIRDYKIEVVFNDGRKGEADLAPALKIEGWRIPVAARHRAVLSSCRRAGTRYRSLAEWVRSCARVCLFLRIQERSVAAVAIQEVGLYFVILVIASFGCKARLGYAQSSPANVGLRKLSAHRYRSVYF